MSSSPLPRPRSPLAVERATWLDNFIRTVPDYPLPGVLFRDITPLLQNGEALRYVIDTLAERFEREHIDAVVGIESRGFIFGTPLAYRLNTGFVPIRKKGKLPAETVAIEYDLEYGSNVLEIHTDAVRPGQRVLVVDDLLATGGTTYGSIRLLESLGAQVVSLAFLIELEALGGRALLAGHDVYSLLMY